MPPSALVASFPHVHVSLLYSDASGREHVLLTEYFEQDVWYEVEPQLLIGALVFMCAADKNICHSRIGWMAIESDYHAARVLEYSPPAAPLLGAVRAFAADAVTGSKQSTTGA